MIPKDMEINGSQSSQYLTGLLMAVSISAKKETVIKVKNPVSWPYIEMTVRMMRQFGHQIDYDQHEKFVVSPYINDHKKHIEIVIESDWSSASFFIVAAALSGSISISGLSVNSLQADRAIINVLNSAGIGFKMMPDSLEVHETNTIQSFEFDATHCPDLFPILAVLASFAQGDSVLKGVNRLHHKESNRAITIMSELNKLGADISLDGDFMKIKGNRNFSGGMVQSHQDHRIAMALSVAALRANAPVYIQQAEVVSKSFPDFFKALKSLGASLNLIN